MMTEQQLKFQLNLVEDIGHGAAKIAARPHWVYLEIMNPGTVDEGAYAPAQSVTVNGVENIRKLATMLNFAIEKFDANNKEMKNP